MRYIPSIFDVLDDAFNDDFTDKTINTKVNHLMRTDIFHNNGLYTLNIELPGYDKSDIKIELKNGYLTISGKHEVNETEKDVKGTLIRSERSFGNVSRSYYVGSHVKSENVKAKFTNGILSVTVPDEKYVETTQSPISID